MSRVILPDGREAPRWSAKGVIFAILGFTMAANGIIHAVTAQPLPPIDRQLPAAVLEDDVRVYHIGIAAHHCYVVVTDMKVMGNRNKQASISCQP